MSQLDFDDENEEAVFCQALEVAVLWWYACIWNTCWANRLYYTHFQPSYFWLGTQKWLPSWANRLWAHYHTIIHRWCTQISITDLTAFIFLRIQIVNESLKITKYFSPRLSRSHISAKLFPKLFSISPFLHFFFSYFPPNPNPQQTFWKKSSLQMKDFFTVDYDYVNVWLGCWGGRGAFFDSHPFIAGSIFEIAGWHFSKKLFFSS